MHLDVLTSLPDYQELANDLRAGQSFDRLGLPRAARLPLLAVLQAELQRPFLLLTGLTNHALSLVEEYTLFSPQVKKMLFPEPTSVFYENSAWGEVTHQNRLQTLTTLAAYHLPSLRQEITAQNVPFIVAPARAVMTKTLPRRDFILQTQVLKRGQQSSPDTLARHWYNLRYQAVTIVTAPGQYARRGGILDIWPIADPSPTRLDFFGDEIDTLRSFDPATQRTVSNLEQIMIPPAREFTLKGTESILQTEDGVETILNEFHIPLLYPNAACLLHYLPSEAIIFVDDSIMLQDTIDEVEKQALSLRRDAIQTNGLPEDFPLPYHTREEIEHLITSHQHVILGPVVEKEDADVFPLRRFFNQGQRFGGKVKPFLDHIAECIRCGDHIIIVSRQTKRLMELWQETPLSTEQLPGENNPAFIQGSLGEGWVLIPPEDSNIPRLQLVTDGEIFGWQPPQARRRASPVAENPEANYADLHVDDLVVHIDFGIGIYKGLVKRTIDNIENEYLCIEYDQGDQLFVPVYQTDRITRYVGADGRTPSPHRLGSTEWQNIKARVKENVEEVAHDLLQLYAARQVVKGYAYKADTPWQAELEGSFPYVETKDQLKALAEVKQDMERNRPMDRLICGDVGYGKTEIALRAAFKAVMEGKQVAILVPTTVLAQQHFTTFRDRLTPFPITVEMLSRFRTPQEQTKIITRLAQGSVDIIIGTHRLFSADVRFKDLGLLIIDEEQRFGVTHKEALKKMRTEVDVLTLTATPIPRTLYMALTDIRDISIINTPPAERLPVITHVGPYSQRLVRQAILREIERGGQVFFVHNRVQTIEGMRQHLEKLVPEARVSVVHGQMPENTLSKRMQEFSTPEETDRRVDILLSTSIIESGLDIPNANTLIVDRADTFGLAQLYQLRGRIGRGAQRAYAFFFRHRKIQPTPEGRLRLETLAEYTHLGAGFSIAMRDLEIRGAGEMLGTQQHGQIAAVGFHLYTRLLADAVRRLQTNRGIKLEEAERKSVGLRWQKNTQVSVDLPLPISIPMDYISDTTMRLGLYRRLAELHAVHEVDSLQEEFYDRFGAPSATVINLFYQLKVKIFAEQAGLATIYPESNLIALRFPPLPKEMMSRSFPNFDKDVRIGKNALWLDYQKNPAWQDRLLEILSSLVDQLRPISTHPQSV